jgi:hypothetical protein
MMEERRSHTEERAWRTCLPVMTSGLGTVTTRARRVRSTRCRTATRPSIPYSRSAVSQLTMARISREGRTKGRVSSSDSGVRASLATGAGARVAAAGLLEDGAGSSFASLRVTSASAASTMALWNALPLKVACGPTDREAASTFAVLRRSTLRCSSLRARARLALARSFPAISRDEPLWRTYSAARAPVATTMTLLRERPLFNGCRSAFHATTDRSARCVYDAESV